MSLVLVGILWGATNPLMKVGAEGIEKVRGSSYLQQFFNEISFLVTNAKAGIPCSIFFQKSLLHYRSYHFIYST